MDKKFWIIIILILVLLGVGAYFFFSNTNKNNNSANTSSQNDTSSNNTNISESNSNESSYSTEKTTVTKNATNKDLTNTPSENRVETKSNNKTSEVEIASFSTKIYTKDSGRQNNVGITCSALNNTDVAPNKTFSFTKTIGPSTSAKGYKEADIFKDGEKTKGLGGGNCQVSTTLYNAVLKVNGLTVTERHEHSNDVPYIKDGKDAAVAYGSYDFKFVNNLDYTIRIKASNTKNNITIKLVKLQ